MLSISCSVTGTCSSLLIALPLQRVVTPTIRTAPLRTFKSSMVFLYSQKHVQIGLGGPFFAAWRGLIGTTDRRRTRREESMEPSLAAVEVRKDETTRLYEALIDGQVVGNLAYETAGGRATLTHSYVDPEQRHRGIASALGPVWSCDQGCDPRCRIQRRPAHNSSPAW
ncbi:GNAT family N-acetyltransferase [Streptomyces mirabilis]|uniref:GNAT family N-acetyltransferase n=1 Tax=Streptomyces mirabilis TaxID=68239 RepID=UPI00338F8E88